MGTLVLQRDYEDGMWVPLLWLVKIEEIHPLINGSFTSKAQTILVANARLIKKKYQSQQMN